MGLFRTLIIEGHNSSLASQTDLSVCSCRICDVSLFLIRVAVLWVAYGFYTVAVFVTLTKLAIHGERCFWRT